MSELIGIVNLEKKLAKLGARMGLNVLSKAARKAATPTTRAIRSRAPRAPTGSRPHKTHKGRTVFPGFLKRSVKQRIRRNRRGGSVRVEIGVRPEAFYGIAFLDKGIEVTTRRARSGKGRRFNRPVKKIKPYRINGRSWFTATFIQRQRSMEQDLGRNLKQEILRVIRG